MRRPVKSQRGSARRLAHRRARAILAVSAACTLLAGGSAHAAGTGLLVVPTPSSGPALSYFKPSLYPGHVASAGAISLINPTRRTLQVALDPVAGTTDDTLGSGYELPATHPGGSADWLELERRRVTLPPGGRTAVAVSVTAPAAARPGDYLAGVSIEALGQAQQAVVRRGIAIASVIRYAIGVETIIPGPRRPLIRFSGAQLERRPAGVTFLLDAANRGNVILQNVHGAVLITSGSRVVTSAPLGPGTFVTHSSIAYPILTAGEQPREGAAYRVRAYLRYGGGIARLDTRVRFGHAAAVRQQAYGGPAAGTGESSGLPTWLAIALGALATAGLLGLLLLLLLWRRRRSRVHSAIPTLEAALADARASGEPLGLMFVEVPGGRAAAARLEPILRSRLREVDRLCPLEERGLLVVALATDLDTAEAMAGDLQRRVVRACGEKVTITAHAAETSCSAAELLQQILAARTAAGEFAVAN